MATRNGEHHTKATVTRSQSEELAAAFPPLLVEAEQIAHTVAVGLHGRRRAGPGEMFWQHRPYTFGDPVSSIDWRQSARAADRLYVRQNEWEAAAAVWIWRDPSQSLDYASTPKLDTKRRRADLIAMALAILLAEAGERVGLVGARDRPFHGRGAPTLFFDALTNENAGGASAPPHVSVNAHSRIVYLSDFFTDPGEIRRAAQHCANLGARGVLVQITDPYEEEFPFQGRTEFEDLESRDKLTFGDAASLRGEYAGEFAAHRAALIDICTKLDWTFIAHRTDHAPTTAMLALFSALSGHEERRW
ncbi:MAG: DUF58 domain-containing protein [Parvularculaceae bacterium]|nr:DUF58 domain-containing protein [Parvularculaceae bacterium]